MPSSELWAGALSLLLRHSMTGCIHSAHQAADLLERLADLPGVDRETRKLCEEASARLTSPRHEVSPCRRN